MTVSYSVNTVLYARSASRHSRPDEMCNYLVRTVTSRQAIKYVCLCGSIMGAMSSFVVLIVHECVWVYQSPSAHQHVPCLQNIISGISAAAILIQTSTVESKQLHILLFSKFQTHQLCSYFVKRVIQITTHPWQLWQCYRHIYLQQNQLI